MPWPDDIRRAREKYRWHINHASVTVLAALLVLFAAILPLSRLSSGQFAHWRRVRNQLGNARNVIARMPELDAENRRLAGMSLFENASDDGVIAHSKLLAALTNAARRSQIGFISIRPLSVRETGDYSEQVFRMELRAGYHQIGRFLSALCTAGCIVRLSEIALAGDKSGSPLITASLEARAFFLKTRMPAYGGTQPGVPPRSVAAAADTAFSYKARHRDPFLPTGATAASVAQVSGASYRLKGIIWDASKPLAVIMDGAGITYLLRAGEQIGTDRIVSVGKSGVVLRRPDGIRYELKTWE
ncbi:hypothetical protein EG831_05365 [bacterium]|nr:hypothetical protein [bacterium]